MRITPAGLTVRSESVSYPSRSPAMICPLWTAKSRPTVIARLTATSRARLVISVRRIDAMTALVPATTPGTANEPKREAKSIAISMASMTNWMMIMIFVFWRSAAPFLDFFASSWQVFNSSSRLSGTVAPAKVM